MIIEIAINTIEFHKDQSLIKMKFNGRKNLIIPYDFSEDIISFIFRPLIFIYLWALLFTLIYNHDSSFYLY